MTYQVLARKWRPQDFASLIGQASIVQALRNALVDRRIAQAYLFSGIRGVGKTTAARVLAKALNCEQGPAADPCNNCTPCREITAGSDLDVLEVDAATYSKVEQVRDLTESLKYGPTRDRYKVVVLDEVHRLSRQAFDALLKIVEEPPPRLVFIFATTEVDAVPATILSRCQEFNFRRVPTGELQAHLSEICLAEQITASPNTLRLIARAGEGSVRDSVALLDQLATYGAGAISDHEAARLLGGLDTALLLRLLRAILAGDGAAVSTVVSDIEALGSDPRHAFAQFLTVARDALHLAQGADATAVDLPHDDARELAANAAAAGASSLLRLLHVLLSSEPLVRRSEVPSLAVEIAWLRAAELPRLVSIEGLLTGANMPAAPPSGSRPLSHGPALPNAPSADRPARATDPLSQPARPSPAVPRPAEPPAVREPNPPSPQQPATPLQQLLDGISRRRATLAAQLTEGAQLRFDDGVLVITVAHGNQFLGAALERDANRATIAAALAEVSPTDSRWRVETATAPPRNHTPTPTALDQNVEAVRQHPTVQAVLDIFGGTIARLEPRATAEQPAFEEPTLFEQSQPAGLDDPAPDHDDSEEP